MNVAKPNEEFAIVGKSKPRIDAREKVTGKLRYIADVDYGETLHAKVLRSPYPHARIKRIDTSKAAALPGVVAVLTA